MADATITARNLVTRALRLRKVLAANETVSDEDASDGLIALNAFLKTLSAERSMVWQILQEQFTLSASSASRTIGVGGNFNTTRPTRIEDSFLRISSQDHVIAVVDIDEYDAVSNKADAGIPSVMAYRPAVPLGTIYFYRAPDQAYTGFYLNSWKPLVRFTSLSDTFVLPPEYDELLVYNLCMRMSEWGGEMSREAVAIASETRNAVKGVNRTSLTLSTEIGYMGRSGLRDINNG